MKKTAVRLLSICLIAILSSVSFGLYEHTQADDTEIEPYIFFGKTFSISGDYYIIPEYTDYFNIQSLYTDVEENIAGYKIELSNTAVVPDDGDRCLVVGDMNQSSGCITSTVVETGIEWIIGRMNDGKISIFGKEYIPVWSDNPTIKTDCEGSLNIFGRKHETSISIYAICPSTEARTTITGIISEVKEDSISIDRVDGQGRSNRLTSITVPIDDNSVIFEGRNMLSPEQIIAGRVCACKGILNHTSKTMDADVLICNAYQATDSGRLIGLTDNFDGEFLRVKTSINSSTTIELKVLTHGKSYVIMDGQILTDNQMHKIPSDKPIEMIGSFSKTNSVFIADVLTIQPDGVSDFVFGYWEEEYGGIRDSKNVSHPIEITENTWFDSPGGSLADGRFVEAWITQNTTIACYVPQLGILGVRVSGWFVNAIGGSFELKCHNAMDTDLQGSIVDIICDKGCKAIKGGQGPVDIRSIPKNTYLHCWGIPNGKGQFRALMVSVH